MWGLKTGWWGWIIYEDANRTDAVMGGEKILKGGVVEKKEVAEETEDDDKRI